MEEPCNNSTARVKARPTRPPAQNYLRSRQIRGRISRAPEKLSAGLTFKAGFIVRKAVVAPATVIETKKTTTTTTETKQ
jgi:hypothetical protein